MLSCVHCWLGLGVCYVLMSLSEVAGVDQVVEPSCYQCYYEKYLDFESGDDTCRRPKESTTATEKCPSNSCAKREVNSYRHYQVQRYCLSTCRELEFQYEQIKGQMYCCVGHLCNGHTRVRYDWWTLAISVLLSVAALPLRVVVLS